ncbi:exodeoxyribonuclease VII large subunit [Aeromicrobium sp. Leaf272]|uniref:exodeoxyribonuclease VII large subunit n=1 Tax=Aeromicrobium sp. Leaf272 TaxID=1736317 RepID=UPI0007019C4A|nr:exodeoxyribonuclease VII large subunit [Aeromicrobium sp. Leaf272]KQP25923.1 exodeoxyribonuclease VII large subunit [Aeromicrobium sp. Leaf272]
MALDTSADSPAPLRQVSTLIGQWVGRLGPVWVEAEVAQLTRRPGICFLVLRDLRATLSVRATCHASVLDASPAPVTEGARVVVHAKPEFYEPNGSLTLQIREIRPAGEGELLAQLERRKQLLAAEGLFDARLKKPLPFLPGTVGLVTGRASAAERDVLENARLRWPGVRFEVRHALMQGSGSARAVAAAVEELASQVDVIVVARGGGSLEDLLPFSDEALVRTVHACRVPVVSAIGHEQDTPLLDLVADVRASTPTDAAKRVVPDAAEENDRLAGARTRLRRAVSGFVAHEAHALAQLRSRPVLAAPLTLVDAQEDALAHLRERTHRALGHRLDREHDAVGHHLARVRALSPLATLERGYAVAQTADGHVLTSVHDVPDAFVVRLPDGSAHVTTDRTEETRHDD